MRVRRALYESALILYRRALTNGSTRTPLLASKIWKFEKAHLKLAKDGLVHEAKEIFDLSNKFIAHRVDHKARKVNFPLVDGSGSKIIETSYIERLDLIVALQTITNRYIDLLQKDLMPTTLIMAEMISIPQCKSNEKK